MSRWRDSKRFEFLGPGKASRPTVDARNARIGGFYFEQHRDLIHRHVEALKLHPDQTGHWELTVDLELPTNRSAVCEKHGGENLYLFPLVFLRKAEKDADFTVKREDGASIPFPLRKENAWVSSIAAAHAARKLLAQETSLKFSVDRLQPTLHSLAAGSPYDASVIHDQLLRNVARASGGQLPPAWEGTGFASVLRLLVEHSLMWVILRGRPGQRRRLTIGHDFELKPSPIIRWRFGSIEKERGPQWLDTGREKYGRRGRRISFGAIGQRLGQPLAWMPIEFDFSTIYTKRCRSYHFELVCPPGLSPRGLKVIVDDNQPGSVPREEKLHERPDTRTTKKARVAHHHRPGSNEAADVGFRVQAGVGEGAFPILWTLAASVTALLLWTMAATDPKLHASSNEIAAGILLLVPALLGGIVLSTEHEAVTKLLSGARILLLVTGLCALAGVGVLIGATPFALTTSWSWTVYAIAATAVTVPLATSWLLSAPIIWRQLEKLESWRSHYIALAIGIIVASLVIAFLTFFDAAPDLRIGAGAFLLLATVVLTLLANNRLAVPIGHTRRYAASALFSAALVCFVLACTELRAAISYDVEFQTTAEYVAIGLLLLSPFAGLTSHLLTRRFRPKTDEKHVSTDIYVALVSKLRVRELAAVRQAGPEISPSRELTELS
jgi:hypothetical protein